MCQEIVRLDRTQARVLTGRKQTAEQQRWEQFTKEQSDLPVLQVCPRSHTTCELAGTQALARRLAQGRGGEGKGTHLSGWLLHPLPSSPPARPCHMHQAGPCCLQHLPRCWPPCGQCWARLQRCKARTIAHQRRVAVCLDYMCVLFIQASALLLSGVFQLAAQLP